MKDYEMPAEQALSYFTNIKLPLSNEMYKAAVRAAIKALRVQLHVQNTVAVWDKDIKTDK